MQDIHRRFFSVVINVNFLCSFKSNEKKHRCGPGAIQWFENPGCLYGFILFPNDSSCFPLIEVECWLNARNNQQNIQKKFSRQPHWFLHFFLRDFLVGLILEFSSYFLFLSVGASSFCSLARVVTLQQALLSVEDSILTKFLLVRRQISRFLIRSDEGLLCWKTISRH